jgi:hypothetical protein
LRTGIEGAGEHGAAVKTEPEPSADPAVTAAQAQIEIARQAAAADPERSRGVSS